MNYSEIINTINRFNKIISKDDYLNNEERFFIEHFELELAKNIMYDIGEISARKLARILLVVTSE